MLKNKNIVIIIGLTYIFLININIYAETKLDRNGHNRDNEPSGLSHQYVYSVEKGIFSGIIINDISLTYLISEVTNDDTIDFIPDDNITNIESRKVISVFSMLSDVKYKVQLSFNGLTQNTELKITAYLDREGNVIYEHQKTEKDESVTLVKLVDEQFLGKNKSIIWQKFTYKNKKFRIEPTKECLVSPNDSVSSFFLLPVWCIFQSSDSLISPKKIRWLIKGDPIQIQVYEEIKENETRIVRSNFLNKIDDSNRLKEKTDIVMMKFGNTKNKKPFEMSENIIIDLNENTIKLKLISQK